MEATIAGAPERRSGREVWIAAALVLFGAVVAPALVRLPLTDPSEMRYVEAARQMEQLHSLFVPRRFGEVYAEKPPGWFWATIGAARLCGGDWVWGARLVSAFGFAVAALAAFGIGRVLRWRTEVALAGASVFLASAIAFDRAHRALIDSLLLAPCTVGLLALLGAAAAERRLRHLAWTLLAAAAAAAAVLIKGPVGLLLIVLGAVVIGLGARGRRGVAWGALAFALAAGAAAGFGWLWAASREVGDWFWDWMLYGQIERRVAEGAAHEAPWWFYGPSLLVHFLPWTIWAPGAIGCAFERGEESEAALGRRPVRALWAHGAITVLLFSCFSGKRTGYLLPIYPVLALALAWALARAEAARALVRRLLAWPAVLAGRLLVPLTAFTAVVASVLALAHPQLVARLHGKARAALEGAALTGPLAFGLAALGLAVLSWLERTDGRPQLRTLRRTMRFAAAFALLAGAAYAAFMPGIARANDPGAFVREAASHLGASEPIAVYGRRFAYFWSFHRRLERLEVLRTEAALHARLEAPDRLALVVRGREWRRLPDALRARFAVVIERPIGRHGVLLVRERTDEAQGDGGE